MIVGISPPELDVATSRPPSHRRRRTKLSRRRALLLDGGLLAVLVGAVFVVHDVAYMFSHPFWLDEAWVAVSTRASLSQLPWVTSSTPIGWSFLLRLVPAAGTELLRIVPLTFTALTVVAAYLLGRQLGLFRHLGGLVLGAAALLCPAMLVRDDLKQYTAEAFASVVVLLLVARIEDGWTRQRLAGLTAFVVNVGFLFTNTVVFVGVAAMAGLVLAAAIHRQWRRMAEIALSSLVMVAGSAVVYELAIKSHRIPRLTNSMHWQGYYVPHSPRAALSFIRLRVHQLAPYIGSTDRVDRPHRRRRRRRDPGAARSLRTGVRGSRHRHSSSSLASGGQVVHLFSATSRTSTFLVVMVTVLMAIGLLGGLRLIASWNRAVIAAVALVAVVAGWVVTVQPDIRVQSITNDDVRSQVQYVDAHLAGPRDVVILSYAASWGFGYYERSLTPSFAHVDYTSVGFLPAFPGVPWLVQMKNSQPVGRRHGAGPGQEPRLDHGALGARGASAPTGRIWIIRSHMEPAEILAWEHDLAGKVVRTIDVGPDPLLLYRPAPPPND